MTNVKSAPRTATTIKVRSKSEYAISRSRDPYHELMLRLFQEEATAERGGKFLSLVEQRQRSGQPLKIQEWEQLLTELDVSRSAFLCHEKQAAGRGIDHKQGRRVPSFRDVQPRPDGHGPMVVDCDTGQRPRELIGRPSNPSSASQSYPLLWRFPCTQGSPDRRDRRN